jgi:hypothetical protein
MLVFRVLEFPKDRSGGFTLAPHTQAHLKLDLFLEAKVDCAEALKLDAASVKVRCVQSSATVLPLVLHAVTFYEYIWLSA